MDFIKVVFSAPMIQAYGITETAGFTSASSIWETRAGVVGSCLPCLKMKLRDIPSLGYLTTDDPPRGEVLFKGNSIFKGYFRNKELTDKVMTEDGWLRCEDVAYLNEGGGLTIIDRMNSFCKLQSGRFVPPQSLENMYSQSPFISQIFIWVDMSYDFVLGFIVPDKEYLLGKLPGNSSHNLDNSIEYQSFLYSN
jgi:long-chain acyl-CoA synthetase